MASFRIPNGTSKELKDLLLKLLKRNAKDRINFEQFFEHPFMKPVSKPLPVPKIGDPSYSPVSNSSPQSPVSYGSPLMMHLDATNSSARDSGTPAAGSSDSSEEQVDDFVIVHKPNTNDNPHGKMASSPSGRTLPEPVPVPTQRENYEKIQRSKQQATRNRQNSGQTGSDPDKGSNLSTTSDGSPKSNVPDVAQLTPPDVQFVIGTPPGHRPVLCSSLVRRQSAPILNANITSGQHAANIIQRQHTPPYTLPVNSLGENRESVPGPYPWTIRNPSPLGSPIGQRRSVNTFIPSMNRAITFCEGTQMHGPHTTPSGTHCCQGHGQFSHFSGQRSACCCHGGGNMRPISVPFASPPDFDDGIHFVPPELPAETLLDKEHNEILAKLNFVLTLVECIMNIAETRASPIKILTESTGKKVRLN